MPRHRIQPLPSPVAASDLRALAELLVDAVDSGAAVSFLAPLAAEQAEEWWRTALAASICTPQEEPRPKRNADSQESSPGSRARGPLGPSRGAGSSGVSSRPERSSAIVLVARDEEGNIAGTVQLQPAWAPNQPHRAEVVKLLVHRRSRGAGLGVELMQAIENSAREAGFTLLTLDAKRGGAADRLYRRLGWRAAGTIPRYAVDTDGVTPHDAVIFYKELA